MNDEKFDYEISTLKNFMSEYCIDKHTNQSPFRTKLTFNGSIKIYDTFMCEDCQKLFEKASLNISNCPHEIKPKCRKCPNPCHEKTLWKQISKIMRYSGIKLGFIKIKKLFKLI